VICTKFKPLIVLTVLAVLLGSTFLSNQFVVQASTAWPSPTDFGSNFDNYAVGIVSPFPFTFTGTTTGCGTGCSATSETGTVNNTIYQTPPYSYQNKLSLTGATLSTATSVIGYEKATVNATSSFVNVTVYVAFANLESQHNTQNDAPVCQGTLSGNDSIAKSSTSLSGNTASSASNCGVQYSNFTKMSIVFASTPGKLITVFLNATLYGFNQGGGTFTGTESDFVYFDTFSIVGAAAYTSSQGGPAINLQLLNDSSSGPYWFDPSGYTGSFILSKNNTYSNTSAQWTNAPLSGLSVAAANIHNIHEMNLITVSIGGSYPYSRTLIPPKSGTLNFFLDNPLNVNPYVFQIQSPGLAVAGDYFFVTTAGHNITSGTVDSSPGFSAYLIPGFYGIRIENTTYSTIFTGTYSLTPSTTAQGVQTTEQILIANQTSTFVPSGNTGISISQSVSGTILTSAFKDSQSETTFVNMTLYIQNRTGLVLVGFDCFSTTSIGSCTVNATNIGVVKGTFSIQTNLTQQYRLFYSYTRSSTSYQIGPYPLLGGALAKQQGNDGLGCILGTCVLITASFASSNDILLDLISIGIVIATASAFSPRFAGIGTFIIILVTGVMLSANWINLSALGVPVGALAIQGVIAAFAFLDQKEKEVQNVYST